MPGLRIQQPSSALNSQACQYNATNTNKNRKIPVRIEIVQLIVLRTVILIVIIIMRSNVSDKSAKPHGMLTSGNLEQVHLPPDGS